jgi:hypothetical protein
MKHRSEALLLYTLIEDRLKQNPPVTIPELRRWCIVEYKKLVNKELVISEEALEQDIIILKTLLQIAIRKSKLSGKLYIPKNSISFLDIHKRDDPDHFRLIFKYIFENIPDTSVYYHTYTPLYTKGWERLMPVRKAIKELRRITFNYRMSNGSKTYFEILPYRILCENLNWYLVGHHFSSNEVNIFWLKKIFNCELGEIVLPEEMPLNFTLYKDNINT